MRIKETLLQWCLVLGAVAKHSESDGPSASSSASLFPSTISPTTTSESSAPSPSTWSESSISSSGSNGSQPSTSIEPQPSSQPSSSIPIQFNPVPDFTSCQTASISWQSFSESPMILTIAATNDRSTQNSVVLQMPLVTQFLSSNVSSTAGSIFWPAVNIPNGTYALLAFQTGNQNAGMIKSNLFNVTLGTDTNCLDSTSTSSPLPVASLPPGSATEIASDGSSTSLSMRELTGVVVGVILGVLALIAAFSLLYRKGVFRFRRPRRPGAPYYLF